MSFFGPYYNEHGVDLLEINEWNGGDAILAASDRFAGPGHNSIVVDDDGTEWILYHAYDRDESEFECGGAPRRSLMIDELIWSDGYPGVENDTPALSHDAPTVYGPPDVPGRGPPAEDELPGRGDGSVAFRQPPKNDLMTDPLVAETAFEPATYEPRLLRARLDENRYPSAVESARLDIRWFTSGDFSVHYVEATADSSQWECQWDRHPNDHNTRVHFHRPPNGTTVEDLSLQSLHPLDVYSTVLDAVERRIEMRWDTDS